MKTFHNTYSNKKVSQPATGATPPLCVGVPPIAGTIPLLKCGVPPLEVTAPNIPGGVPPTYGTAPMTYGGAPNFSGTVPPHSRWPIFITNTTLPTYGWTSIYSLSKPFYVGTIEHPTGAVPP